MAATGTVAVGLFYPTRDASFFQLPVDPALGAFDQLLSDVLAHVGDRVVGVALCLDLVRVAALGGISPMAGTLPLWQGEWVGSVGFCPFSFLVRDGCADDHRCCGGSAEPAQRLGPLQGPFHVVALHGN